MVAYRGTNEDLEWLNNFVGVLVNVTGEEPQAIAYAQKQYATYAPDYKIYLTGHSLGGYLAQVAAASLIMVHGGEHIGGIEYFNGIGLNYGNIASKLIAAISKNPIPIINTISQENYIELIQKYKSEGGTVLCHKTYGDPVSLIGEQTGDQRGPYKTDDACLENHLKLDGEGPDIKLGALIFAAEHFLGSHEVGDAVDYYNQRLTQKGEGELGFLSFAWSAHETDGFFYNLGREDPGYY